MLQCTMQKREINIDILKTIGVILMSFVHVNTLLFTGKGILDGITYLGSTVCFSIFLFAIGYINGKKVIDNNEDCWAKVWQKVLWIHLCYLLLGMFSLYLFNDSFSSKDILNLVLFNSLPLFTEFLISLIFFTILSKLLFKPLKSLIKKPYLLISISLVLFLLGSFLSKLDVTNPLLSFLQKHLVGFQGIHLFPVFQYMPVYIMGVLCAKYGSKLTYAWAFSLSFLLVVLLKAFGVEGWYRWPPSLSFILYGMIFISFVMFLLQFINENKHTKHLTLFGKYPLLSLFLLTVITFLVKIFLKEPSVSHLLLWFLNISILALCYLGIYLLKK